MVWSSCTRCVVSKEKPHQPSCEVVREAESRPTAVGGLWGPNGLQMLDLPGALSLTDVTHPKFPSEAKARDKSPRQSWVHSLAVRREPRWRDGAGGGENIPANILGWKSIQMMAW